MSDLPAPKRQKNSEAFDSDLAEQLQAEEAMHDDDATPLFKGPPMLQRTMTQMAHEKHGRNVFGEFKKPKIDKKKWGTAYRVGQQQHAFGGAGKDEMISTAWTREHVEALRKAKVPGLDLEAEIGKLSGVRVNTDALVWHASDGEIGAHPGALRSKPTGNFPVVGDHNLRDAARAKALSTEFADVVADPSKATAEDVQLAHKRVVVRAQLETVARFSQPQEQFEHQGAPTGKPKYHVRYGDIRDAGAYGHMANYIHNERERFKWQVAQRMLEDKHLAPHVPPEYVPYLKQGGDQVQGEQLFHADVAAGKAKPNTATTSQAHLPAHNETLRGRSAAATSHGQRALSPPRGRRS